MSQNGAMNRLISKIVFAGLLVGTLPISLPLHGQPREALKKEVNQKIKDIKRVVDNLKKAKIIIPSIVFVVGASITALAIIAAIVMFGLKKKYISQQKLIEKELKALEESKQLIKLRATLGTLKKTDVKLAKQTEALERSIESLDKSVDIVGEVFQELSKPAGRIPTEEEWKKIGELSRLSDLITEGIEKTSSLQKKQLEKLTSSLEGSQEKIVKVTEELETGLENASENLRFLLKAPLQKSLDIKKWREKKAGHATILSLIIAVITGIATPFITFAAFKFISKASMEKALEGAMQLRKIEKEHPGILTAQQKRIIAQFKKLYKDPVARGIIQGRMLDTLLRNTIDDVEKNNPSLIKRFGRKKARKLFAQYIKLTWQEEIFKKAPGRLTSKITQKKRATFETRYPLLTKALKSAVQTYTTQANAILEELREEMMQVAEKAGLKKMEMMPQQVVPL